MMVRTAHQKWHLTLNAHCRWLILTKIVEVVNNIKVNLQSVVASAAIEFAACSADCRFSIRLKKTNLKHGRSISDIIQRYSIQDRKREKFNKYMHMKGNFIILSKTFIHNYILERNILMDIFILSDQKPWEIVTRARCSSTIWNGW